MTQVATILTRAGSHIQAARLRVGRIHTRQFDLIDMHFFPLQVAA